MRRNMMGQVTTRNVVLLVEDEGRLTVETVNDFRSYSCTTVAEAVAKFSEVVEHITKKEEETC